MAVTRFDEMTWTEVRDLEAARTVAVLPVGAIEAHGPHLPLSTDVIISEAMAAAGAERLAREGRPVVLMPSLFYTAAKFAAAFPGTISLTPGAVTLTVLDVAASLSRQGFAALAIANSHLDPTHLASLQSAATLARERELLPVAFPNLTRKPWAPRLTDEFRTGACHAGRFEGSIVLAARPDLVREEIRAGLAPNPASLSEAIRAGHETFEAAGGGEAYFGWPADATREEGERTIETLGAILAEATEEVLSPGPGA